MSRSTFLTIFIVFTVALLLSGSVLAQTTTLDSTFAYQGQLTNTGGPVNGNCDFQFSLFNAVTGGLQIGSTLNQTLAVSGGLFNTQLDFGDAAFDGTDRYLSISVRCPAGSGTFTTLTPRQAITPTPYALGLYGLSIENNATSPNLIGGFTGNNAGAGVVGATIGGGGFQGVPNQVTGDFGTVGGGWGNTASSFLATVGGGGGNTASGTLATVGGGNNNMASGDTATVGGGQNNTASAAVATIGGGSGNSASGVSATVPGGMDNIAAGASSFAAGNRAQANHRGTFVWGDDSTPLAVASTGVNQFIVRAAGGLWFGTTSAPSLPALRFINTSTGAFLSDTGVWTNNSDEALKENFTAVDPLAILQSVVDMPITRWNYIADDSALHIGPMAQDFHAAFGLGQDEVTIGTIDADGVALAAIQGLYQMVQEKDAQITTLEQQNADLEARVAAIEQTLAANSVSAAPVDAASLFNPAMLVGGLFFAAGWMLKSRGGKT